MALNVDNGKIRPELAIVKGKMKRIYKFNLYYVSNVYLLDYFGRIVSINGIIIPCKNRNYFLPDKAVFVPVRENVIISDKYSY